MKVLLASVVSLLLGSAIGYYIGYRYCDRHTTNEAVEMGVQGIESSDGEKAARAVRAIEVIESGEPQKAVQFLSTPIAYYYYIYSADTGVDKERRLRIRAMIEELARTNAVVAARIKEASTNRWLKTP